jgi:hypothetical protein
MSVSSAVVTKAKAALTDVEAAMSKTRTVLTNDFIKSGKAWIAIIGIALILILHHFGIDDEIVHIVVELTVLLLILHYVGQYVVDLGNAAIEVARIKAGVLTDPPPAPLDPDGLLAAVADVKAAQAAEKAAIPTGIAPPRGG